LFNEKEKDIIALESKLSKIEEENLCLLDSNKKIVEDLRLSKESIRNLDTEKSK